MATLSFCYFLAFSLLFHLSTIPFLTYAISNCGGSCTTGNDCTDQLACINGKCNDDPDARTHICGGGSTGGYCQPSGTLINCTGKSYNQYHCSPPVLSSTQATLTINDFSEGGEGNTPTECDGSYHDSSERVVALSTGWYNNGSRCGMMIKVTAKNGRSTTAKVVDECDSVYGCDREYAGQSAPCRNNIVDGTQAVWDALGLNSDVNEEHVYWSVFETIITDESIKCFYSN